MKSTICYSNHMNVSPIRTWDSNYMLTRCAWDCTLSSTYDVIALQSSTVLTSSTMTMQCVWIVFVHNYAQQRAVFANRADNNQANVTTRVQLESWLATRTECLWLRSLECDHSHTFAAGIPFMQTWTHICKSYSHIFASAVTHSDGRCCFARMLQI